MKLVITSLLCLAVAAAGAQTTEKADKAPQFPGGMPGVTEYLKVAVRYPEEARKNKTEGSVLVRFNVNADGAVQQVSVQQSVHPLLDSEAVRVVRAMPNWQPATAAGKPVSAFLALPISFSLGSK